MEYLKYTMSSSIAIFAITTFYEMVEIPQRIEKARLRMMMECSEMTGEDCERIIPIVYRCGD